MPIRIDPPGMSELESHTDRDLLNATHEGDRAAFGELYDRYADDVYTFVLDVTRDAALAASATQDVFARVIQPSDVVDADDLESSLLSMARGQVKATSPVVPGPEARGESGQDDLGGLIHEELQKLGERDRQLMTLHLVLGLEAPVVADVMGIDEGEIDGLLDRMRRRVEGAVGALLVTKLGSDDCDEISVVLGDGSGRYDPGVRSRVNRHIGACDHCRARRLDLLAPGAAVAEILTADAPAQMREALLESVPEPEPEIEEPEPPTPVEPPPVRGTPPLAPSLDMASEPLDLAKLAVFGVITVILGLIGLAVAARFDPLEPPVPDAGGVEQPSISTTVAPGGSDPTTTVNGDDTATSAPATSVAVFEVSTDTIDFGDDGTTARFDVTNTGGQPAEFTVSASSESIGLSASGQELAAGETATYEVALERETIEEGEIAETITVAWDGGSVGVSVVGAQLGNPIMHNPQARPWTVQVDGGSGCSDIRTTVSVRVRDSSTLASVVVRWSPDGGGTREEPMSDVGGDVYEAVIGPFTAAQSAEVRMVATDELGNAGGASVTVAVVACP